ncbi:MAG: 3-phosphoshikimate 1-carboxyvinyltransferase [Oscillospiraceae bacterium]|nr:3-phosphoshikimate 1-carboxyvinyltransferase [Oscillospiraceae bacterium]
MITTVDKTQLHGTVKAKASKSCAHRLLICAALGKEPVDLLCEGMSRDIEATIACLNAMGAEISVSGDTITVVPIRKKAEGLCCLRCGESGSTLRFLLPVVGALGLDAVFCMEGRLPDRPLAPLDAELTSHGMLLRKEGELLYCAGQLTAGEYTLPGNVSSQYISGLLMALPLLGGESTLTVTGKWESAAYVALTENALRESGVMLEKEDSRYTIPGGQAFSLPAACSVEGDWSNGAFWLCAGALLEEGLTVTGLRMDSAQGDKEVLEILKRFGANVEVSEGGIFVSRRELRGITFSAAAIPDLVPVLSVVAAAAEGETRIVEAERLRLKESDRLQSTCEMLRRLGADAEEQPEGLIIRGGRKLTGGTVSAWGDHRIAMSAAVAAILCDSAVTVEGSEAVEKSYPDFWRDYEALLH